MEETSIFSKPCANEEIIDLNQITLRHLHLSDLDDVMVLQQTDEKVAKFWGEPYTSKDEGINFIENIESDYLRCEAICHNDHAIGCIKLFSSSRHDLSRIKCAEIGYVLGSKYWGKGITTFAVKQMVKVAFSEFPYLERLEALVDVDNLWSQRVVEKVGFQKEGVLRKYVFFKGKSRDMIMFSLLSTDLKL